MPADQPGFVDFFAGSGLVTEGLKRSCKPLWSNDICPKKASIYCANHGFEHFHLGAIEEIRGAVIPDADLVWASFPCQDLSLAGKMGGLGASRSGLFWEWIRVLDEMASKPPVIALENVVGLLSGNDGKDYRMIHNALQERGYRVGPMLINARFWVPQSRPRIFIVAVGDGIDTSAYEDQGPNWLHSNPVEKVITACNDPVFWFMPHPKPRKKTLADIIEWNAPVFDSERTEALLNIVAARHKEVLAKMPKSNRSVFPGYRRTRNGKQVLELRFDNLSGCLRTAEGGSSRQFLILRESGGWKARLITSREAALLMGAPKDYELSTSYNESYNAMGDAVAVPVVRYLADHLLEPLCRIAKSNAKRSSTASARIRNVA